MAVSLGDMPPLVKSASNLMDDLEQFYGMIDFLPPLDTDDVKKPKMTVGGVDGHRVVIGPADKKLILNQEQVDELLELVRNLHLGEQESKKPAGPTAEDYIALLVGLDKEIEDDGKSETGR